MTRSLPYKTNQERTGNGIKRAYKRKDVINAVVYYEVMNAGGHRVTYGQVGKRFDIAETTLRQYRSARNRRRRQAIYDD